jgi:NodT family efflux transporter outer membrane factor (OMF) lipoprotein
VVLTAIRVAALDAQIEIVDTLLAAQRRQLAISEARLAAGGVSALEVQNQRASLAQAEAAPPTLKTQRAQAGHLLAVLAGQPPAHAALPVPRLAELTLPATLPLRLPSELVRQRPDIRASEALLHKASATVGVATADLYPRFLVSGSFSSARLDLSELIGNGINVWNIGINVLQPLLRGGELQARQRAAAAAYEQAAAAYRQSVLQGLQDVADALRALEGDTQSDALRVEQLARAEEAYRITRGRFDAGGVSQLALLEADRLRGQARLERVLAQASRYADVAVLMQALGGGGK